MIHHVMINEWVSRSAQSNKMSIQRTNVSSSYSKNQKIFSILNLRMLDELQQNIHFHWHLSPPYNFTKKNSRNHRNILSQTVCALSSIAQTTQKFCNHESKLIGLVFPLKENFKIMNGLQNVHRNGQCMLWPYLFRRAENIFPFLFHIFTFFSPFQLEFSVNQTQSFQFCSRAFSILYS